MITKEKKLKFLRMALLAFLIGAGVFFFILMTTSTWIGYEVGQRCIKAQDKYEGECTEALIEFLDDKENSYRDRNSAIWALGQLGDENALDILNKYYTGNIPDREPLDKTISQYELKKAIKLCDGGLNITKLFRRK